MSSTHPGAVVRPARPRPSIGTWSLVALGVVVTIVTGLSIEFDLTPLFTDLTRGAFVMRQFLEPNWGFLAQVPGPLLETFAMAVIATVAGCAVALVLAMLASRVTAHRAVVRVTRWILSVLRSLPDIAWGLLFVALLSAVGPTAGVLALFFFSVGITAKLTSESVDAVAPGPIEAADASGANVLQRARVAVLPQVLPNYLSYSLYVFELNVRAASVLGIVGGGGIGSLLNREIARFNYDNVAVIVVVIFAVVFLLDQLSRVLRKRVS